MKRIVIVGFVLSMFSAGCDTAVDVAGPGIEANNVVGSAPLEATEQEQEGEPGSKAGEPKSKAAGLLGKAKDLFQQAADSGSEEAESAKKWMTDKFGDVSESGSQVAEDAAQWASDAFDSLKQKGLTSADNASEWVTEDIRNMNALKYKVVTVSLDDLEAVEDKLNELGKLRWDCFHVVEKDGEIVMMLKKERRSLLKNIPVKDMLRLVPLMGDGGE